MHLPLPRRTLVQPHGQIQNGAPTHQGLLVVIPDIDIEDMDGPVQPAAFIQQVVEHGVEAALLAGDDGVDDAGLGARRALVGGVVEARLPRHPVLEALRVGFYAEVAGEHGQEAVGVVERRVLVGELGVDRAVRRAVERVDVWLRYGRSWEPDQRAGAEGDDGERGGGEAEVGFH